MTTHSDHIDADHEPQDSGNDLINQFFSSQGTPFLLTIRAVLLPLWAVQTLANQR